MELTPTDARRFFIDRIVAEAERQGIPFSSNERRMLSWSEVEPGCVSDPEVAESLAREISDEAYEAKVCRLIVAAYERELSTESSAKDSYRGAYGVLKRGDYYLMVVLQRAIGNKLRKWWQLSI